MSLLVRALIRPIDTGEFKTILSAKHTGRSVCDREVGT